MLSRKQFLISSAASFAVLNSISCKGDSNLGVKGISKTLASLKPEEYIADNDDLWRVVRNEFIISDKFINLNNGAVSPQPKSVRNAHVANYNFANEAPVHNMWEVLGDKRENVHLALSAIAGCSPEEIAINRNATEGLSSIIFGLRLKAGDEVVVNKYDYPFVINAWKQREVRDGIKLVFVDPELPIEEDAYVVSLYKDAISAKTKIVHLTHILNWTGQVMPVRKIADIAHSKGCEVVVDVAHSFGLLSFSFDELGADYAAASLHKWLCAPFGTGMLFVKKDKIKNLWPLMSSYQSLSSDIRKFETLGTRSFAAEAAIEEAIFFSDTLGNAKQNRLRFLKNYWLNRIAHIPKVKMLTSRKETFSCGMAMFSIINMDAKDIEAYLFSNFNILTSVVKIEKLNGIRVSPHIYTNTEELDLLVKGIIELTR